jgi:hypothetical protein
MKEKKFSIFDWVKEVTYNKTPWENFTDEQKSTLNIFMLNRILSMNINYLELVNYLQTIPYQSIESYYKIYVDLLPKKSIFNKYIKSEKDNIKPELLTLLASYFECGTREIRDYLDFLDKNELIEILTQMGKNEKEIKNLLKK